jgi:hypothetical protein
MVSPHRPCQTLCTPRRGHDIRYGTLIPNCYLSPPMALLVSSPLIPLVLLGHVLGLRRFRSPTGLGAIRGKGLRAPAKIVSVMCNRRLCFAHIATNLAYGESH